MNGRVYDPEIGRFLSADPFNQAPETTQAFNRYTYAANNPLSFTDPSGFFFKKLLKKIGKLIQTFLRLIPTVGIPALVCTGNVACMVIVSASMAGLMTAANGGSLTDVATTAAITAGTALAFYYVGEGLGNVAFSDLGTAAGVARLAMKTVAHGVVGGVSSKLRGGKFTAGFAAGTVAAAASPFIGAALPDNELGGVIAAAVSGGIGAELGGGKFANGAITGAFSYLFNQLSQQQRPRYSEMSKSFPAGLDVKQLGDAIGGKVDYNTDLSPSQGGFTNGCTIRVCRALNESGAKVPYIRDQVVSGADGKWYIFRVRALENHLRSEWGAPDIEVSGTRGSILPSNFADGKGVIMFDTRGAWVDATGHADLWNGQSCLRDCFWSDATRVMLWQLPD